MTLFLAILSGRSANYAIEYDAFSSRAKVCGQERQTPVWSREDAKTLLDSIPKEFGIRTFFLAIQEQR
jgi:hypothetical protein